MRRIMKTLVLIAALSGMICLRAQNGGVGNGNGQGAENGNGYGVIVVPDSSVEHPGEAGRVSHTNHVIFMKGPGGGATRPTYIAGFTPAQIRAAYNLPSAGGSGVIVIVDAFHYATALTDLNTFAVQVGEPTMGACPTSGPSGSSPCFWQVYVDASGNYSADSSVVTPPPTNCGWNQEAALDIEWAHAMAPGASIVLVEAQSNSNSNLFAAVRAATNIIVNKLKVVGQVSMSWGSSESSYETGYDSNFLATDHVLYFAASGDTGGKTIYPGVSPYVIAAGGTSLYMTADPLKVVSETGWSGSGGGKSAYEPLPDYQNISAVQPLLGTKRGVPDVSFDADPNTGVLVYGPYCSSSGFGMMIFGGTSVSSPALAGIFNLAGTANRKSFIGGTPAELGLLYGNLQDGTAYSAAKFRDITSGRAGKFSAVTGWDFVTGIGSSLGLNGK